MQATSRISLTERYSSSPLELSEWRNKRLLVAPLNLRQDFIKTCSCQDSNNATHHGVKRIKSITISSGSIALQDETVARVIRIF